MPSGAQTRELDLQINAPVSPAYAEILTPEAVRFVARLASEFEGRRQELLARRQVRQADIDAGHFPDFLTETTDIRLSEWTVAPILIVSAKDDESEKVAALDAGANDYLTKPFRTNELLARVRVWLRHIQRVHQADTWWPTLPRIL